MQRLKTKERKRRIDTPGHRQAASRWAAGWHPGCSQEAATQEVARWWPRGSQVVAKRLAVASQETVTWQVVVTIGKQVVAKR